MMEAAVNIPQPVAVKSEQPVSIQPPVESIAPKEENAATKTAKGFIKDKKHGVIRTLGTFIKTGIGELFTYIGGNLVPGGIAIATQAGKLTSEIKNTAVLLGQDQSLRDYLIKTAGIQAADQLPGFLNQVADIGSVFIPGLGIGATVTGLISSAIGYGMGWSGVKHGSENLQRAFKWGKAAEMGTLALSLFNPAIGALYPIVKGFNIATTLIGHTKRP